MQRIASTTLLVALALVQGCGGGDGEGPPATAGEPLASSPAPTDTPAPSASQATGIRLSKEHSSVRAPAGWKRGHALVSDERDADGPDGLSYLSLSEIEAFGSTMDARELGRTRVHSSVFPNPPKLLPVAELDGRPAYHVAGFVTPHRYVEEFGAITDDRIVSVLFSFDKRVPESERERVVGEVVPTFRWK